MELSQFGVSVLNNVLQFQVTNIFFSYEIYYTFHFLHRVITTTRTVTMLTTGTDDSDDLRQSMQEIVDKFMTEERQHP
jgi:hypothetical protein